uniref:hypothetical protein n=1 Tax=Methylobacterium sp. B34 TaxID=95563 RepID=UPI001FCB7137|nr:hypothetical protein [Methylobacterium sp. B34]
MSPPRREPDRIVFGAAAHLPGPAGAGPVEGRRVETLREDPGLEPGPQGDDLRVEPAVELPAHEAVQDHTDGEARHHQGRQHQHQGRREQPCAERAAPRRRRHQAGSACRR